ncbi:unnamed protein product [Sympodiomycopsis kandeliae]
MIRSFRLGTLVTLFCLSLVSHQGQVQVSAAPTADILDTQYPSADSLDTQNTSADILDTQYPSAARLYTRHGDHEHDQQEQPEQTQHSEDSHVHKGDHIGSHSDLHSHSHKSPHVPSISEIGDAPFIVPYFAGAHTGGHSHGHSNAPPEAQLNETNLLLNKGPEPLSYLEWDFDYGMGSQAALHLFTSQKFLDADQGTAYGVMGVSGGRYRTLLDEVDPVSRLAVTQDIASRVGQPQQPARHKWLMLLHIVGASISCFILLPLTLFLRAAKSSLSPISALVYLSSLFSSLLVSCLYKALTPRLYPANAHGKMGWIIFWMSAVCFSGDLIRLIGQTLRLTGSKGNKLRTLYHLAIYGQGRSEQEPMLNRDDHHQRGPSAHRVHFSADVQQEGEEEGNPNPNWTASDGAASPTSTLIGSGRQGSLSEAIATRLPWKLTSPTSRYQHHPSAVASWTRDTSLASNTTAPRGTSRVTVLKNILRYTHVVVARSLPVISFAAAYTGLAVYTGSCRQPYKNVCLAHGIKGGIFFWYGLLTFGRYLGAYADCGWSWNRRPSPETAAKKGRAGWKASMPSAEWVECVVIFTYGATNTWMERFSAQPGDPYTVKQVQHISIAVMYWFAGALGVMLETRWVRNLLNVPVALTHPSASEASSKRATRGRGSETDQEPIVAAQEAPPSYSGSFNPFPALCVGVTGIAMAAHHQDYVYQVQIHELWGELLAGFAVLRCMTYFFLWLRPPMSILPSRPPTEALASFALTAGGLVFMISSEEVSFAAMRNGFGDFMAIMCITVAFICFIFALIAALMVVKAWAVRREMKKGQEHSETSDHSTSEGQVEETVFVLGEGEDEEEKDTTRPSRHISASPEQLV